MVASKEGKLRKAKAMSWVKNAVLHALGFCAVSQVSGFDFQYFVPQEFGDDLPLRNGSFAQEVISFLRATPFPDADHERVDSGFFYSCYADIHFNSLAHKNQRSVCTQVPVGGNPHDLPELCERPGASPPRATILPAKGQAVGRFRFEAVFEFEVPGDLNIKCHEFLWWEHICEGDVTVTGTLALSSEVSVVNDKGQLRLNPTTSIEWIEEPKVHGCHPDWLARHFADVPADLRDGIKDRLNDYVKDNLQSQLSVPQVVQIHPELNDLNLSFSVVGMTFVCSSAPGKESYIIIEAQCTVYAKALNGSVEAFPDPSAPWTGKHNTVPLSTSWVRHTGKGLQQRVLLGGARLSQELLTMLTQGFHYVGVLSPQGSTDIKDATLYSYLDMACPEVDLSEAKSGVLMRQKSLFYQLQCIDRTSKNPSFFTVLNSTFTNVSEQIQISARTDGKGTEIVLQLSNASLARAHWTSFHSQAFIGQDSQLYSLVQQALRRSLPLINRQLLHYPLRLGGPLVPFAPHPQVRTVPKRNGTEPGYVEISWQCQCGDPGYYEACLGFHCPEALESRRLRAVKRRHGMATFVEDSPKPLKLRNSAASVWLSIFEDRRCRFGQAVSWLFVNACLSGLGFRIRSGSLHRMGGMLLVSLLKGNSDINYIVRR